MQVIMVVCGEGYASLQVDPAMTVFPHEGDAIKRGAADILFTTTTDFSGVLISTHHAEQVVGSYARNRAIVYVVQTLFLHEFYIAEMDEKIGGVLDATFGKGAGEAAQEVPAEGHGEERHRRLIEAV